MTVEGLHTHRKEAGRLVGADSPAWQAALQTMRHDSYHLPGYVRADAVLSGGSACAFLYEHREERLLLPLVVRRIPGSAREDAISPYGYPGPVASTADPGFWEEAVDAFLATARDAGLVSCFVRLHPLLPAPLEVLQRRGQLVEHGKTVSIDLTQPADDMIAGFRANHRRQILRAHRAGHHVVVDCWSRLDEFVDMYHETMRRVGASSYYFLPVEHFLRLRAELGDAIHLLLVEPSANDDALAGGLFLERNGIVQYHLGATRTSALSEQPTKLMFEQMCRWGRDRGNTQLHLGSGLGGADDNSLFHFKAGFSDRRHPFHTWRVVTDEDRYRALLAPGAEDDRRGYFPAYRLEDGPLPSPVP